MSTVHFNASNDEIINGLKVRNTTFDIFIGFI